jgi:hypothetical protein
MSSDPVVTRSEIVEGSGFRRRMLTAYKRTTLTEDQWAAYDQWAGQRAMALLQRHYPGYDGWWRVAYDSGQGICDINMPLLMGGNVVIREKLPITPQWVVRAGGEILERYRLPRSRFDLDRLLEVRGLHSRLLMPWEKVPE